MHVHNVQASKQCCNVPCLDSQGWEPRVLWIGIGGCVFFTALEEAKKLYLPRRPLLADDTPLT